MILVIDSGNSRVKWGLHDGAAWRVQDSLPAGGAAQLAAAWQDLPQPRIVAIANVAGEAARAALNAALSHWPVEARWAASQAEQCGVKNGYVHPAQLGCDRWAALIGARHLHGGNCLVVNAGTALTVDALTHHGDFLGGIIVPGLALMQQALAANTAALKLHDGKFEALPDNTADAIYSGALQAMCGAVERMAREMAERGFSPLCVLSGGAAQTLAPRLNLPLKLVDNLVLEGLLRIAMEERLE